MTGARPRDGAGDGPGAGGGPGGSPDTRGFMPDDEGEALLHAALRAGRTALPAAAPRPPSSRSAPGAASPRSTWARRPRPPAPSCSPSTTTAAPRRTSRVGSTTKPTSSTPSWARSTRWPHWRRADQRGRASRARWSAWWATPPPCAARWTHPLAFCFIDGGHGAEPAWADFRGWAPRVVLGGWLAIHDVFPDPADGGRPPYELFCAALASGEFAEDGACGSLRVLRRVRGRRRPLRPRRRDRRQPAVQPHRPPARHSAARPGRARPAGTRPGTAPPPGSCSRGRRRPAPWRRRCRSCARSRGR